jgi:hypothetical protein
LVPIRNGECGQRHRGSAATGVDDDKKLAFLPASTIAFGSNAQAWPATTNLAGKSVIVGAVPGSDADEEFRECRLRLAVT